MLGLAFSPAFGKWIHGTAGWSPETLNTVILATFGVFWTLFEIAAMISNSVFGGLIADVVPPAVIGRFYSLFRAISLIAGIIFNYVIFGKSEEFYVLIFVGLGALYGIGFTGMCLKVREGNYPPPASKLSNGPGLHLWRSTKAYFRECFSISYYVGIFAMLSSAVMGIFCPAAFSIYAAKSFNLSMDNYGFCLAATYVCSLVLAYPLGALADRLHPLRLGLAILFLHAAVTLCGFLFISSPLSFSIIFVIQGVVAGSYFTSTAGLAAMLFPRDRFSQFVSANGLLQSFGLMLLGPALGKMLDISGHEYRYTFGAGFAFTLLALLAGVTVYRQFMLLGGCSSYVPPEPECDDK